MGNSAAALRIFLILGNNEFTRGVVPVKSGSVSPRTVLLALTIVLSCATSLAQSASENSETVHGIVINSITREPIARALVSSPDNRFAMLTNSDGRFEFTAPKSDSPAADTSNSNLPLNNRIQFAVSNLPSTLTARKPGFIQDGSSSAQNIPNDPSKDLTLSLVPEALIMGTIALPTSEAPDSISLQIYRRTLREGRARYTPAGATQSKSDGQFRFAELPAGTYKLFTQEMLDRDPVTFDPRGTQFGYPPVFYPSAPDLESAATIQLSAGQTQTVNLSLVKQPYYRVKVPVIAVGGGTPENGMAVNVYAQHRGPGFSLGYSNGEHAIEGLLPNGTYTVEATNFGTTNASGVQTITVKGAPVNGPSVALLPDAPIPVKVKEEFMAPDPTGNTTWTTNSRRFSVKGPRRYLNISLDPVDDSVGARGTSLRSPTGAPDDPLVIEAAPPGSYWVRVNSGRGYPASVRSGDLDLQHHPLVVSAGSAPAPIEITMRDDTAEISGTVAGITAPQPGPAAANITTADTAVFFPVQTAAIIYCVPLPDSPGRFVQIGVGPEGTFDFADLVPGAYRLLAFDHEQPDLEYRNPEAMRAYDAKGPVVRVSAGQKEKVTLQLIATEHQ